MKVAIRDGKIEIKAETSNEARELKSLMPLPATPCECCGQIKLAIIFDCSVLIPTRGGGNLAA